MRTGSALTPLRPCLVLLATILIQPSGFIGSNRACAQVIEPTAGRPRVAVLDFTVTGDIGVADPGRVAAEHVSNRLSAQRYQPVGRELLLAVLKSQQLTLAQVQARPDLLKGRDLQGIRLVVLGSVSKTAKLAVSARLVDIASGQVLQIADATADDATGLATALAEVAAVIQLSDQEKKDYLERKLTGAVTPPVAPPTTPPAVPPTAPPPAPPVAPGTPPTPVGNAGGDTASGPPAPQPGNSPADNDYFMATWLYNAHKWPMAADEYGKFLRNHPTHARAADAQFGQAQSFFQLGKYNEAATAFKAVLDGYPNFDKLAESQFQLGQSYLGAGQLDQAAAAFAETSRRFKAHHLAEWAEAKRAECLISLKQYQEADPLLAPIVEKYIKGKEGAERLAARRKALAAIDPQLPASFDALVVRSEWNMALAQFGQQKYQPAADAFSEFLVRNPNNELAELARLHRAQAFYFLKQYERAANAYAEVVGGKGPLAGSASFERALAIYQSGDRKKAAEAFVATAKEFPNTDRAAKSLLFAGTCLYEAGELEAAIAQFDALAQSKNTIGLDEVLYWRGMAQLKLNKPADAAASFTEALKAVPNSARLADLKLAQADAVLANNQFEDAARAYERFAASFPRHEAAGRALYTAAFALHRAGQWVDSAKLCAKFMADCPKDKMMPRVIFIAAEDQFLMKNYPQAAQLYRQLLSGFATDAAADLDRARLRLAWTAYFQKLYDEAVPVLAAISDKAEPIIQREALYVRANCLYELKRDDEAVKALDAYLAMTGEKPYGDDALFKKALIHARQNKRELAGPALEQLVREHPDSVLRVQAEYQLAEACLSGKQYPEAIGHYQEVVKREGKGPLAPYAAFGVGLCYYEQGKWEQSTEAFAAVVKGYPDEARLLPQAIYRQGLCFQKLERWVLAENAFADLVGRFPQDPYAASSIKAIGLGLGRQEKWDKAAAAFVKLITDYPQSKELDHAYYELAWCYNKMGNREQMLRAYKELADKFPESVLVADSYYHLADQHYAKKEYSQATELYQASLKASKDDRLTDKALYRIGWCYWLLGRYAEGAEQFDKLIKDCPKSELLADAMLNVGEAYLRANKPSEAADRLGKLVEGPAGKNYAHLAEAMLRLGEAYLALGQTDKAIAQFNAMREKFPAADLLPSVDFGLGRALFDIKNWDEAIKALTRALESPKAAGTEIAAKAQFYIGETCLGEAGQLQAQGKVKESQTRLREALGNYLRVVALFPGYPEWVAASHYELGQVYLQLARQAEPGEAPKMKAEAVSQFQTLVDKYAATKWAELAKTQLEQLK